MGIGASNASRRSALAVASTVPTHPGESITDLIERIEVIDIALPLRREWKWRGLDESLGRWSIVRVTSAGGVEGYGEATPLGSWGGDAGRYFGETPVTVRHAICDLLAPKLVGLDPFELHRARQLMDGALKGHPYAKAAIEIALYDLQGRLCGLPLYSLLGGRVREDVPVAHMVGIMDADEAVAEAQSAVAEGVTALQIKGTGEIERDVGLVRALRDAVGGDTTLRLDANQGYRGLGNKRATQVVHRLEEAGADLIEQPVEGLSHMAAIRSSSRASIVADESCWQPQDLLEVVERGAADAISIYIGKAGGLASARRVSDLADTVGLPCDVNGSLESGIGNAANVHFAVSSAAVTLACVIPVTVPADGQGATVAGRYFADDVVADPFPYRAGRLGIPPGPGLGITVDTEKLEHFKVS
jgi:L-alanine-DL-glutamate epimerase-like enolase superfamily enzyme